MPPNDDGERTILDNTFVVKAFKQYLPKDKENGRGSALVQFFAMSGGLRTVRARDIVSIK